MTIINGALFPASQQMAQTQWVWSNLLLLNSNIGEWPSSGLVPTFISATSFSVPGNQTAIFIPGRRIQTVNTGGTIYSTVTSSIFAAGITTVTVVNDSGVLDAGLSVVNVSALTPINRSAPSVTRLWVTGGSPGAMSTGVAQTQFVTAASPSVIGDVLGEFAAATGKVTVTNTGWYFLSANFSLNTTGVTFNGSSFVSLMQNAGVIQGADGVFGAGVAGSSITSSATPIALVSCAAGDTLWVTVTAVFSAGAPTVIGNNSMLVIRIS